MIRTDGRPTIAMRESDHSKHADLLDKSLLPGGPTIRELTDGIGRGTLIDITEWNRQNEEWDRAAEDREHLDPQDAA